MPTSGTRVRGWLASYRPRPVVLSSPYPADECLRQLAVVTTRRGAASWYLDSRNAGRRDPRFRGEVGPSRIWVARFEDAAGRNSFAPWLDVRLEPAAGGGAALTGRIGLHPAVRAVIPMIAGVWGLIALGTLAAGVALLVSGHISGLLPALVIPLAGTAVIVGFNAAGLRSMERDIPRLIEEMHGILGSAATFPGPAVVPAAGRSGAQDPGLPPSP